MSKKIYYRDGQYINVNKKMSQKHSYKKITVAISIMIILGIAVFLKQCIYTEQYYWTNELIRAIELQNETKVEKLLEQEDMDINQVGGVEFPAYLILADEFMRVNPLQHACWYGDYNIVEMLIEYGADEKLDEALNDAVDCYDKEDCKIVKLLLSKGANPNAQIEEQHILISVAEWNVEDCADYQENNFKHVEQDITDIYKILLKHSVSNDNIQEIKLISLEKAKIAKNYTLIKFLNEEINN